jgi:hypothetical protein
MKLWILGTSVVAAAIGALAQDDGAGGRSRGLVKVAPAPAAPQQGKPSDGAAAWRERLTDADLDRREQAFSDAVQAAARDERVRGALEEFARDERASGELAWTARLALREVERSSISPFHGLGGPSFPRLGLGWPPDLEPWIDDWMRRFERLDAPWIDPNAPGAQTGTQFERFELEVGPDGVKCTVKKTVDGVETSETYTSDSIEELLEAHPELADRVQVGGHLGNAFRLRGGALDLFDWPWSQGRGGAPWTPRDGGAVRTDVLGVVVRPLESARASELGLDAGVGLVVERVEPGTIARSLRIERGHVLVELNGRALRGRDDITEALRARAQEGAVEVVLFDRWGQRRERSWKPDASREL